MAQSARIVGYVRVSTDQQVEEGVSLAAQAAKLRAYSAALGLCLIGLETDAGKSAKTLARPGLQAALARLESGEATGLLVVKLDRLTRSVRDLGTLIETYFATRFDLLSVHDSIDTRSAAGRLVLHVLASVGQWEREATGERTREALAHRKAQGVQLGAPALETQPAGRHTAVRIRALRAQGMSLRAISLVLESEGHRTHRGGRWGGETVRKVLVRSGRLDAPPPRSRGS